MPIAILKFKLPEENVEFETATDALDMSCRIDHFYNFLRTKVKHGDLSEKERKIWDEIYSEYQDEFHKYLPNGE